MAAVAAFRIIKGRNYFRYHQMLLGCCFLSLWVVAAMAKGEVQGRSFQLPRNRWGIPTRSCPMAFTEIGKRCYFYGYFPLNWFRATEFCHSFGESVSLTVIETEQENDQIKKWLTVNGNHDTGVWVGGSENGHHGKWAWFPTGQLVEFENWGPSQPSGGDQHCMYLVGGLLGYQWADFHCDFEMNFLCEFSVNDNRPW